MSFIHANEFDMTMNILYTFDLQVPQNEKNNNSNSDGDGSIGYQTASTQKTNNTKND